MKGPWIKLWRSVLSDPTLSFCMRRYGNDIAVLWIGILTNTENGVLAVEEDILADQCILEEKRYRELRSVLVKRGMIEVDDDDPDGKIVVPNWFEYQESESAERVRRFRERKKASTTTSDLSETDGLHSNAPVTVGNGNETETSRVEVEIEEEGEEEAEEREEFTHTARAREESPEDMNLPPSRFVPNDYPKMVREEWEVLGDRVVQVDPIRWATAVWPRVSLAIKGIHSRDVVASIRNLGTILRAPPGTYYLDCKFTAQAFFERHVDKFVPANFAPENFRKSTKPGGSPRKADDDPRRAALAAEFDAYIGGAK